MGKSGRLLQGEARGVQARQSQVITYLKHRYKQRAMKREDVEGQVLAVSRARSHSGVLWHTLADACGSR